MINTSRSLPCTHESPVTTRLPPSRIVTREIPIAKIIGAGLVKSFDTLKNNFNGYLNIFWSDEFSDLRRNLFGSK
jgi:hypothetical protein